MNQLSLSNKYYLTISNDNRIHIYDIHQSNQQQHREQQQKHHHYYVEKNHLSHSYLCSSWYQQNSHDLGYYGVGTSDGLIIIWDFTRGVVIQTIGIINQTSNINNLIFIQNGKSILVSYPTSSQINEYNIQTGELIKTYKGFKKGTLKLCKNPINSTIFLAANQSIKYFDHEKSSKFKISSSFTTDGPSFINYTPDGLYLICTTSGSHNSDDLLIYNFSSEMIETAIQSSTTNTPSPIETPCCTYSTNGKVKNISIKKSSISSYELLIHFHDQRGCLLIVTINDNTSSPGSSSSITIQSIDLLCEINGNITPLDNILAINFNSLISNDSSHDDHSFTLVIGKVSMPQFIKYSYTPAKIVQNGTSSSLIIHLLSNEKVNEIKKNPLDTPHEVTILGPHESGGIKRPLVHLENGDHKEGEEDDDNEEEKNTKKLKYSHDDTNNITLEDRLRNISTNLTLLENHQHAEEYKPSTTTTNSSGNGTTIQNITSDSLVILLEQSLQSMDDNLLEQCLSQSSDDILYETIQRLPSNRILQLLKKLINKFEKKSSRGLILIKWISMILRCHTSYLLSIHDLSSQLIGLNTILEQRLSTYMKLSSLAGRLDLMMSHISLPSSSSSTAATATATTSSTSSSRSSTTSSSKQNNTKGPIKNKNQPKQIIYED